MSCLPKSLKLKKSQSQKTTTMKNNISKWLKCGTFAAAAIAVFAACSDDHFDVITYNNSDKTLWENIKADASLSQFANLMSRITLMKGENDRSAVLKFSELLNQDQTYTVVAPVDGSFDYAYWDALINEANENLNGNTDEKKREGRNMMYLLSNQFGTNHIARFSHNLVDETTVHLLNGKNVQYKPGFFNEVALLNENILGRNGMLYKLTGINPFAYNLYDYLSADDDLKDINAYIKDPEIDKETFSESASTPGALNEEGQMVYIDSVYIRTNELLDRLGVSLTNEDSCYVGVIPSNDAWAEAKAKVEALYNYGTSYCYDWSGDHFTNKGANAFKVDAEALRTEKANEAIITNMFFAPYRMGLESKKDRAIIDYMMTADSLISTTGTIFYNEAMVKGERNQHQNPAFEGAEIVPVSNGYVMKLPSYKFNPAYVWQQDLSFRPSQFRGYTIHTTNCMEEKGITQYLTSDNYNERTPMLVDGEVVYDENDEIVYTGIGGAVEENQYQMYEIQNPESTMDIDFKLSNVLSGDYKIELVLVPSNINLDNVGASDPDFYENLCFYADIYDDADNCDKDKQVRFGYDLVNSQEANNKKNCTIIPQMKEVTTLTLYEKFHFDKCYKGVNTPQGETFPRLRLTVPRGSKSRGIVYAPLNIVKVICTPYRESETAE